MQDHQTPIASKPDRRQPWNKGKIVGPKPPLRLPIRSALAPSCLDLNQPADKPIQMAFQKRSRPSGTKLRSLKQVSVVAKQVADLADRMSTCFVTIAAGRQ